MIETIYLNSIRSTIRLTLTIRGPDQNNSYLTSKTRLLQVPRSRMVTKTFLRFVIGQK